MEYAEVFSSANILSSDIVHEKFYHVSRHIRMTIYHEIDNSRCFALKNLSKLI